MIEKDSQFSKVELHTYVAALTNHGLVQWLPKIKLQTKKEPFPSFMNDTGIQVKAGYEEGDTIKVTPFGYDFMKICKSAAE